MYMYATQKHLCISTIYLCSDFIVDIIIILYPFAKILPIFRKCFNDVSQKDYETCTIYFILQNNIG